MKLTKGMLLRVRDAAGTVVVCLEGMVWLTEEGDAADHFLACGQRHRIAGDGVVVLEALHDAHLDVQQPTGGSYGQRAVPAAAGGTSRSVSA